MILRTFTNNMRVFLALVRRDMYVLSKRLKDLLLNDLIVTFFSLLTSAYLLPLMGMPHDLIAPMFLGSVVLVILISGVNKAFLIMLDVHQTHFFDYQLIQPLSKTWLFLRYAVSFFIETTIQTTIPLAALCFLGLTQLINLQHFDAINLCIIHVSTAIFTASLLLVISFSFSFTWFVDNLWARFFTPLLIFSSALYPWKNVYAFSKFWAYLFLLNPLTYVIEGYRTALLGTAATSWGISLNIVALTIWTGIMIWWLRLGVKKQLDPV